MMPIGRGERSNVAEANHMGAWVSPITKASKPVINVKSKNA
jgi:hypothetical protein